MLRLFRKKTRINDEPGENDIFVRVRKPGSAVQLVDKMKSFGTSLGKHVVPVLSVMLLISLIIVPIFLFGWFLFFTDVFVVQAVTVVDAREHTIEGAKNVIGDVVADLPLGRNIFLVNTELIESAIVTQIPQVRTVHVARKLPGTIKAIIQEKTPSLLLLSGGKYYFIDNRGVAYEEARLETLPGVVLPIVKNDDQSVQVTIGVRAVAESFVSFIIELEDIIPEATGAQLAEMHIPSLAAREVHLQLDNNWLVLVDATRSAKAQAEVLRKLLSITIEPAVVENLEYIDLRIPNRVYYRESGVFIETPEE